MKPRPKLVLYCLLSSFITICITITQLKRSKSRFSVEDDQNEGVINSILTNSEKIEANAKATKELLKEVEKDAEYIKLMLNRHVETVKNMKMPSNITDTDNENKAETNENFKGNNKAVLPLTQDAHHAHNGVNSVDRDVPNDLINADNEFILDEKKVSQGHGGLEHDVISAVRNLTQNFDHSNNDAIPVNKDMKHDKGRIEDAIISVANKVRLFNKTVMVTLVNDAYLPFANSWLCNTKDMGIHKSVVVITGDQTSKDKLRKNWSHINVFVTDIRIPKGDQEYSHFGYIKIMIRRTEIIMVLLSNNIDVLLFEFDYVWFANPLLEFQTITDADMLVNPVSDRQGVYNGGLIYLFATDRTRALWKKLTEMMNDLGGRASKRPDESLIPESENDQQFLSTLINQGYANIRTRLLQLDKYSDGKWYELTEVERNKTRPILISNNWIIGNKNKIARAQKWKHWFVKEDGKCDDELVRRTVYM